MAEQITWGGVKSWAEANGITDDAVIVLDIADDEHAAVDIDSSPAEEALPPDGDDPGEPAVPASLIFKSVYG